MTTERFQASGRAEVDELAQASRAGRGLEDADLRVMLAPLDDPAAADDFEAELEAEAEAVLFPAANPASSWERRLRWALLTTDCLVLILAVLAAYGLRLMSEHGNYRDQVIAVALVPTWLVVLGVTGAYDGWRIGSAGEEVRRVIAAGLRTAGVVAIAAYGLQVSLSRVFLLLAVVLGVLGLLVGRGAARVMLHRLREQDRCLHSVVVAGHAPDVRHVVEQARRAEGAGFHVVAACVPGGGEWLSLEDGTTLPVLGEPANAATAARQVKADVLAIASDSVLGRHEMRRLAWELEKSETRLLVAPRLTDVAGPRISIRPLAGLPLLHVEQPHFSGIQRAVKGLLDRVVAVIVMVLLLPVLLVATIAIRLDSRGRALYSQERAGLDGEPFTCWKLRSMVQDAHERRDEVLHLNKHENGVLFKSAQDPRITRVGRFLRRTSMDELPQLWNVVRGDMSLVGPRPPLPDEVDAYEQDVRRRLLVKPGLTGLWQVSGRADLSWEESVRLDLFYVENWSPALDVAIVARTVLAILSRRGAY